MSAFRGLQGVNGNVYLVGEIVQTGSTSDPVDVDLTDTSDRDTVAHSVPFPVQIKVISGVPQEPYIDVSPGTTSTAVQGSLPSPDEVG